MTKVILLATKLQKIMYSGFSVDATLGLNARAPAWTNTPNDCSSGECSVYIINDNRLVDGHRTEQYHQCKCLTISGKNFAFTLFGWNLVDYCFCLMALMKMVYSVPPRKKNGLPPNCVFISWTTAHVIYIYEYITDIISLFIKWAAM